MGTGPQFSANVRCGQRTGWTKMAICMEVGLSPGDFVFDGDPATPRIKGTPTPTQIWYSWISVDSVDFNN